MTSETPDTKKTSRQKRAAGEFYGRRKTKPLKRSQELLMGDLLPKLNLDLSQPAPDDLRKLFPTTPKKLILEIGFGGGEHMIARATTQPENGFIGCEPFINGMGKALSAIDQNKLSNIRLYDEDATDLLDWLPAQSLEMIYLLYPDPWHKKRHWKRRFVSQANLKRFARLLKPGCELRIASDIAHYINWTLNHCHKSGLFEWQAQESSDWNEPWEGWQSTRYEKKALREGRVPCYLTFLKVG